ncbi:DUF2062 domain-containing protein [Thiomicrospira sp. R3]|uniref:DUF2062 domain-containing protein n=1 Tax=Thiomicrospira sp. R3 TaxID=3035472 RepID=UPI00259B796F|nr:DUF2062 domain-containing protein [Thiomicrospira sp. R3]WFE68548.1 DUF2062 domain-containing protein [Thiomicrospira sp. R3]
MTKKLFRKWMPDPKKLYNIKGFNRVAHWFQDPNLWHLNRNSVAKAFFIGPFWAAMPMPWQMLTSAISAMLLRANLPLSVALVWISNPITMGPIWYFNYRMGALLLGEHAKDNIQFEMSLDWLGHSFIAIWQPLLLGSLVVGLALGTLGYFIIHLLWRIQVNLSWRKRHSNRRYKKRFKKPKFHLIEDSVHKPLNKRD